MLQMMTDELWVIILRIFTNIGADNLQFIYRKRISQKKIIKQFFSIISVLPAWNKFSIALQKNPTKKQIRDMTESKSML